MSSRLLAGRNALTGEAVEIEVVAGRIESVRPFGSRPAPGAARPSSGRTQQSPRAASGSSGEADAAAGVAGAAYAARAVSEADDLPWISPGLVDIQVNGYAGHDYSSERLAPEEIGSIVRALAASGTTQHTPTIVTAPGERIVRNLRLIAEAAAADPVLDAAIAGIHVEGPFISAEDGPRGAHPRAFVRPPDFAEYLAWEEASRGRLAYITVAPELPGAIDLIERVVRRGVRVAIGHTAALPEEIARAAEAGATLSTHLGNGSHTMMHRHRSSFWEQLASDRLSAGIICDGFHLPASLIKIIARAKPAGKLFLVSDAAPLGGLPAGSYEWLGSRVEVGSDGRLSLSGGEILAGAGHLLDRGVVRFMSATGLSLAQALPLVTSIPAALVGVERRVGRLEPGMEADLTLFRTREGVERLVIEETLLRGETLFRKSPNAPVDEGRMR